MLLVLQSQCHMVKRPASTSQRSEEIPNPVISKPTLAALSVPMCVAHIVIVGTRALCSGKGERMLSTMLCTSPGPDQACWARPVVKLSCLHVVFLQCRYPVAGVARKTYVRRRSGLTIVERFNYAKSNKIHSPAFPTIHLGSLSRPVFKEKHVLGASHLPLMVFR